jgi:hypothetical protein
MRKRILVQAWGVCLGAIAVGLAAAAGAQTLSGAELTIALRHGGYVLVMSNAHSPTAPPNGAVADPENLAHQRQLDPAGRKDAEAMGQALQSLGLPIDDVLSSPTYRALETIKLANLEPATPVAALGDGDQGLNGADPAQAQWLRAEINEPTPHHSNRLIVTQPTNILAAFPTLASGLQEGEALVFEPSTRGDAGFVARIPIQDWPTLSQ